MIKIEFAPKIKDFFTSSQSLKVLAFFGFTLLMTAIVILLHKKL